MSDPCLYVVQFISLSVCSVQIQSGWFHLCSWGNKFKCTLISPKLSWTDLSCSHFLRTEVQHAKMKLCWVCSNSRWTRHVQRTIKSIRRWVGPRFSSTKPSGAEVSVFQTEETKTKLIIDIMQSVRIIFCLLSELLAAAAAAQEFNQNIHPAAGRFRDQRPDQIEVQEPAGIFDPGIKLIKTLKMWHWNSVNSWYLCFSDIY